MMAECGRPNPFSQAVLSASELEAREQRDERLRAWLEDRQACICTHPIHDRRYLGAWLCRGCGCLCV